MLVLDSFFIIIFGGALAAKIYQHWQVPAYRQPIVNKKTRSPKPTPPMAKPVEQEKAPEPASPAAVEEKKAEEEKAEFVRPPKPSLLQETHPDRRSPKPHDASAVEKTAAPEPPAVPAAHSAAAPSAAFGKQKAIPVDFQLKFPGAKNVVLAGAFIVRGGKKSMVKDSKDLWTLTLYLTPNTYRYYFIVDGKRTLDPRNPKTERNASVVAVVQP